MHTTHIILFSHSKSQITHIPHHPTPQTLWLKRIHQPTSTIISCDILTLQNGSTIPLQLHHFQLILVIAQITQTIKLRYGNIWATRGNMPSSPLNFHPPYATCVHYMKSTCPSTYCPCALTPSCITSTQPNTTKQYCNIRNSSSPTPKQDTPN